MEDIADYDRVRCAIADGLSKYLPLWKPYILSCLTKDEILVCLKYDLQM